jgi:hypothetical protein
MGWEFDDFESFGELWSLRENREVFSKMSGYLEGLGVYVKEGLIPIRLVALTMTGVVTTFWKKFGPIIVEYRVQENRPRNLSETEYLYDELVKYIEKHPELAT